MGYDKRDIRRWFFEGSMSNKAHNITIHEEYSGATGMRIRSFNFHNSTMMTWNMTKDVYHISNGWPEDQIEGDDYKIREFILDALVSGVSPRFYVVCEFSHHIQGAISLNGTADAIPVFDMYFGITKLKNGIYCRESPTMIVPSRKHLISIPSKDKIPLT